MKLIFALLVGICAAQSVAAEIYKWKDKDGTVRYSDMPPPAGTKDKSTIGRKTVKPTGQAPLSPVQTNEKPVVAANPAGGASEKPNLPDVAAELRRKNEEVAKRNKAEQENQAKIKVENCNIAKANYQAYLQGGRIYKVNEKGEREYIDDAAMKEGAQKAQQQINENC
jgi:Domain of unknown function (DUF4124)